MPEDPGSRVPFSPRRIAECLLSAGAEVRLLGTTAFTRSGPASAYRLAQSMGFAPKILEAKTGGRLRPEVVYRRPSGLECRLVDVGSARPAEWDVEFGRSFDVALEQEWKAFAPEVVVMRPGGPADRKRRQKLRERGVRVVLLAGAPGQSTEDSDAVVCPTEAIASAYPGAVAIPVPVAASEVESADREPLCTVFVPPSRENGLFLLVRLAEQLSLAKPEEPILVLTTGGASQVGQAMLEAGRRAGFELGQYDNVLMGDPTASPDAMWSAARVLVAPAVEQLPTELVTEALVAGIPVIASDVPGADELLGDSGVRTELPFGYDLSATEALPATAVEPWAEAVEALRADGPGWEAASDKAREAGRAFDPATLGPRYLALLERVLRG